ncbi:hypothetical protein DUNSADRAFT_7916 [Dunaliella salina]|uniref:Uncharacterized protein n=1 Tax=Dunaliella salina TaxID=3046 RepID=A0ABQ7GKH1_DUNSA|nr:hypothetical protein DUNSADRAFT_7916 [Dunaliella salina]|eukprot:KAF5835066.1 hypothetical protein DUNSADRAFT_7916 [Dunaliella salina]
MSMMMSSTNKLTMVPRKHTSSTTMRIITALQQPSMTKVMFVACAALLLLFVLTIPAEDALEDEDGWDTRQLGLGSLSRSGGRGLGRGDQLDEDDGKGQLLGARSRHRAYKEGPYYQEGMLQQLMRVEPKALESPYLPSVKYWAAYADRRGIREYLQDAGFDPHPKLVAGEYMTCLDAAKYTLEEPFHPSMLVRNRKVPEDLPGGAPLAAWRWDSGIITREEFDAVPKNLRTGNGGSCAQCARANAFKIQGGRLYTRDNNEDDMTMRMYMDMFILAAHLYDIPDMDFIVHTGDGAVAGMPLLATNIHRDHPQGGFTIPYITDWNQNATAM